MTLAIDHDLIARRASAIRLPRRTRVDQDPDVDLLVDEPQWDWRISLRPWGKMPVEQRMRVMILPAVTKAR